MIIFNIAIKSLLNRFFTSLLTILSIGFSVFLFIGIYKVETNLKNSFTNTISKTDLVVGARGSPLQLFLSSIFHIGFPTNNIDWQTYQFFKAHPSIKWA
ncbi:MAG: hypothetical protein K2X39_06825, partial [Silvanigrellaceae bacterium]|nr:hypothetical protein [Silvanigrellaceae bacterium]